jgi:hypothetical protein
MTYRAFRAFRAVPMAAFRSVSEGLIRINAATYLIGISHERTSAGLASWKTTADACSDHGSQLLERREKREKRGKRGKAGAEVTYRAYRAYGATPGRQGEGLPV